MKIEKMFHKKEHRIKVLFPYNNESVAKMRQIEDAKWSASHKAWHIPYTKPAYDQLLYLFPELEPKKPEEKKDRYTFLSEKLLICLRE